jgi:TDG/mug DNA glycosylase family protein
LNTIVHNGGESFRQVKVVEKSLVQAGWAGQVTVHRLPSTSPANASWTFDQKLTAWRAVLIP